jgi:putative membrane protein
MMGFEGVVGFGGLWMIVPLLFWAGVITLAVWGVSNLFPSRRAGGQLTPPEILKQRYARGEISAAEFQQAKQELAS